MMGGGSSPRLGADVVLEFDKSIKNIQSFAEQMELLDTKFGRLDQRIDGMRASLSSLSSQTSKATGSDLRKNIENELNNIAMANGVVLSSIGTAPLKVKQQTVRHLFARVDAELNRAILRQIGNINIQVDPNVSNGNVSIGQDEFALLNKEIASLVRTQVNNLVKAVRREGGSMVSAEDLKAMQFNIGKDTVNGIMSSVKDVIRPILLNPEVPHEGVKLTLTHRDMASMLNKIKAHIKNSMEFDVQGAAKTDNSIGSNITRTTKQIDGVVNGYVDNIRRGMATIQPHNVDVPIENLTKSLRKYIAKDLGTSVQNLEKTFSNLKMGEVTGYELRRQFSSLENVINTKMRTGTSQLITELKKSVREVEITGSPQLKHHLISEINKLNNTVVKKIREQIDNQFRHMKAEIDTINTNPKDIRRSGRIRNMADGYGRSGGGNTVINNYGSDGKSARPSANYGSDPFARRDEHFSSFGLEGAISNTFRHIIAGGMVGAPMMAMYDAFDTFKVAAMEQQKIFQNYMLKDDYQVTNSDGNSTGEIDFAKVQRDVDNLVPTIKDLGQLYAIDYKQMSQVGAVASRMTNSTDEAKQFMDFAGMITRLDNEADIVEVVAPGLEAIMGQFDKSVWEMGDAVKSLLVASNMTKATTDELMKALQRSGASFNVAGMDEQQAIQAIAVTLQKTGLSGENIGNYYKTLLDRLGRKSTESKLQEAGIDLYKTDENGIERRVGAEEILTQLGNMWNSGRMSERKMNEIIGATAGGFQQGKLMASIGAFGDQNLDLSDSANYHKLMERTKEITNEELFKTLSQANNSNVINMERAQVAMNLAFTSVIESLAPAINHLSSIIVEVSDFIRDNSQKIAALTEMIGTALVGYASQWGVRKLGEMGGYQGHVQKYETVDKLAGGRRSIRGGVIEGSLVGMDSLIGGSRQDRKMLTDKRFLSKAYDNETLRPYLENLANMSKEQKDQFRDYLKSNPAQNMSDLFMATNEYGGFEKPKQLTDEERFGRSQHNMRSIANNKSMSKIIATDFASQLVASLEDKNSFDEVNSSDKGRSVVNRLAGMDERGRQNFENYLTTQNQNTGMKVKNFDDMANALESFESNQRKANLEARQGSVQFTELSRAIGGVNESMKSSGNASGNFFSFLDKLDSKSRGTVSTIGALGRSIGSVVKQVGAMMLIGEVVSGLAERPFIDQKQEAVINAQGQVNRTQKAVELFESDGILQSLGIQAGALWNTIRDPFSKGDQHVGIGELNSRHQEMRAAYLREGLKEGWTTSEMPYDEFADKYMQENGYSTELERAQREKFMEDYEKAAIDMDKQEQQREEAEAARRALKDAQFQNKEWGELTSSDIKERLQLDIDDLQFTNSLTELNGLMSGLQTHSEEYIKMKRDMMLAESSLYLEQISQAEEEINALQKAMKDLEDSGGQHTTDKDGNQVLSEEYVDLQGQLTRWVDIRDDIKEFERIGKQKEYEAREWYTQQQTQRIGRDYQLAKVSQDILDAQASYTMDRNSGEYRQAQQDSVVAGRELLEKRQLALQEEMTRVLSEGGQTSNLEMELSNVAKEIAGTHVQLRDLRLQQVGSYKRGLDDFGADQDLDYLQQQLRYGNPSDDSPIMKQVRMKQSREQIAEYSKHIANLQADYDQEVDVEVQQELMREIKDLQRKSLQAQLGMLDEMKSTGGTFNLPDGVRPMNEYDYYASRGTHNSMTMQTGDMYVNVVMPNVKDGDNMAQVGQQFGYGIMQGRNDALRSQLAASPWNYKTW